MARPTNISPELKGAIDALGDALDQRKGRIQPGWEQGAQRNILVLSIADENGQSKLSSEQEKALTDGLGKYSAKIEDGKLSIIKPAVYSKRDIAKFIHRMNRELLDGTAVGKKKASAEVVEPFGDAIAGTAAQAVVSNEVDNPATRREMADIPSTTGQQNNPARETDNRPTPLVDDDPQPLAVKKEGDETPEKRDVPVATSDANPDDKKPPRKPDNIEEQVTPPVKDVPDEMPTPPENRQPTVKDDKPQQPVKKDGDDVPENRDVPVSTSGDEPNDGKPPRKPDDDKNTQPPVLPADNTATRDEPPPIVDDAGKKQDNDKSKRKPDDENPPIPPKRDEPENNGPPDNNDADKSHADQTKDKVVGSIGDFLSKNVIATGITIAAGLIAGGYGVYKYLTGQSDKKEKPKQMKANPEIHAGAIGVSERKVELKSRERDR